MTHRSKTDNFWFMHNLQEFSIQKMVFIHITLTQEVLLTTAQLV